MQRKPQRQTRYFTETDIIDAIEQAQEKKRKLSEDIVTLEKEIREKHGEMDRMADDMTVSTEEYTRFKLSLDEDGRLLLKMGRQIKRIEEKRLPKLKQTLAEFRTKPFGFIGKDASVILAK